MRCGERTGEEGCERVRVWRRGWARECEREFGCECDGDDAAEAVDEEKDGGMGYDRVDSRSDVSKKAEADDGASRSLPR